jgi:hypothetical protein
MNDSDITGPQSPNQLCPDRETLRRRLLDGAASAPGAPADAAYFEGLRARVAVGGPSRFPHGTVP